MRPRELVPHLLFGGAFDRERPEQKAALVRDYDIRTVVCLRPRFDVDMPSLVEYIYAPIPDGRSVAPAAVEPTVALVVERVQAGKTVLVHCIAGRNRSGLIVGLALRDLYGMDGRAARDLVLDRRPNALYNPAFVEYLCRERGGRIPPSAPVRAGQHAYVPSENGVML